MVGLLEAHLLLLRVLAASARPNPGLAVGVGLLIGVVTGAIFDLLLLQIATAPKTRRGQRIAAAISECLSLPGFWFGGPWLTGQLLAHGGLSAEVTYYTLTLAGGFLILATIPLYRLVAKTAEAMRKA